MTTITAAQAAQASQEDFLFLQRMLLGEIGYALGDEKLYLVESRLSAVAAAFGMSTWADLVTELRARADPRLREAVCEAMTTNETSFFRYQRPFDFLRTTCLPALIAALHPRRRLRIWSAACSSGQEAYSSGRSRATSSDWCASSASTSSNRSAAAPHRTTSS
jgi:chemotaxis protein methyltransferase CheR